jgi:hypothetical protein
MGGATVQDVAPKYQAASDAYQQAITQAAAAIEVSNPPPAAVARSMSSMEQATRRFLGDVRPLTFPDAMRSHVANIQSDSQSLADQDHLLAGEAGNLSRADVARWNQLDSAWRADDKQLRTDLSLPVPDFDNH